MERRKGPSLLSYEKNGLSYSGRPTKKTKKALGDQSNSKRVFDLRKKKNEVNKEEGKERPKRAMEIDIKRKEKKRPRPP